MRNLIGAVVLKGLISKIQMDFFVNIRSIQLWLFVISGLMFCRICNGQVENTVLFGDVYSQSIDFDGDGSVSRNELTEQAINCASVFLAFQRPGKLSGNKSVQEERSPTFRFNLLQVDRTKPIEELSSLVRKFAALPENPDELADQIKGLDNTILINSSMLKLPLGKSVEIETHDPMVGSFTRLESLAKRDGEIYLVSIEFKTERQVGLQGKDNRGQSNSSKSHRFSYSFAFKEGGGSATFKSSSTGVTVLGLLWEEIPDND